MSHVTLAQIAEALGVHRTSALRRAAKEGWPYAEEVTRGGTLRLYPLTDLPREVREALTTHAAHQESAALVEEMDETRKAIEDAARAGKLLGAQLSTQAEQAKRDAKLNRFTAGLEIMGRWPTLTDRQVARMQGRFELVQAYEAGLKQQGQKHGTRALDAFAQTYMTTLGLGRSEETRAAIKKLSGRNLRRWVDGFRQEGLLALLDEKDGKNLTGHGKIEDQPELREFVVGVLVEFPHVKDTHLEQAIAGRFGARLAPVTWNLKQAREAGKLACPERSAIKRFRDGFQKEHASAYMALKNPDKWKNEQMLAFGNASEDAVRPNYRWEMDSTPGDLLLLEPGAANGTARYHVLGTIDVWSRRARLLVAKTSKATAIGSLVRRAILDWGRPERAKHDNGSDYCASYLDLFFDAIGTEIELCQPFSGWQKPHIERLFRTFNHDLVELLPGYIGHNVAERKELEARAAFSERLFQKDGVLPVSMTAEAFQDFCDDWCDNVYAHNAHRGLNDVTPFDRMASWAEPVARIEDERALDVLLAPLAGRNTGGYFSLQKKGIRIDSGWFIAAELGAYAVGARFQVRQDVADAGRAFVFDDEGKFVAVAMCPEKTGISPAEIAAAAKAIQRRTTRDDKADLRKTARKAGAKEIVGEVLRSRAEAAGKLVAMPARGPAHTTPGLAAAGQAARAHEAPPASASQMVIGGQVMPAVPKPRAPVISMPTVKPRSERAAAENFAEWESLKAAQARGETLSEQDARFIQSWPTSSQGKSYLRRAG